MKNRFSLVSTYISWSSLSLPTPRMRKTSDSCMVSAAHPLVTRRSYRLFRFSSFCYVMKGVIIIDRPPLSGDWINISAYILPQLQKNRRDSGCISFFNDKVPATVCVSLYVCANHFTSDCHSNKGQYKAGFP